MPGSTKSIPRISWVRLQRAWIWIESDAKEHTKEQKKWHQRACLGAVESDAKGPEYKLKVTRKSMPKSMKKWRLRAWAAIGAAIGCAAKELFLLEQLFGVTSNYCSLSCSMMSLFAAPWHALWRPFWLLISCFLTSLATFIQTTVLCPLVPDIIPHFDNKTLLTFSNFN